METRVKKVIVAIHGIGDQTEFTTIKNVFARFCDYHGGNSAAPLGSFHNAQVLMPTPPGYPSGMDGLAFTEVYWANIPRKIVEQGYKLESANEWAKSTVARLQLRTWKNEDSSISKEDCPMVEQVLKEGLQTLKVLDRLCYLGSKLGIFHFDLNKVMLDYLDDVQIVADFHDKSAEIVQRFSEKLTKIHDKYPDADIYLVSHSEGTVVALLGLLEAMCGPNRPGWLDRVRGWMTLGSPIDKHLKLWPDLFTAFQTPKWKPAQPIDWRNYYDFGDPVGFELDEARARFTSAPWVGAFNFRGSNNTGGQSANEDEDDYGFTRYKLPGEAHNEYWNDNDVFGHFIKTVVYKGEDKPPTDGNGKKDEKRDKVYSVRPQTRPLVIGFSYSIPYLVALVLLFVAVFTLSKALGNYAGTDFSRLDLSNCLGITALLAGLTVWARIVRLTRPILWWLIGAGIFLLGILVYLLLACCKSPLATDFAWQSWFNVCLNPNDSSCRLNPGLVRLTSIVAVISLGASLLAGLLRRPNWGMRTLLWPALGGLLIYLFKFAGFSLNSFSEAWPVLLAAAFFFYLWWLVALIFDLVFIWHRYIRHSKDWKF